MNFRLDYESGTMVCNVTPESADRLEISGYARFGGSLLVIMTGEFSEAGPHRYTLAHTAVNLDGAEFRNISIKYPVEQGFRPTVTFVDDHYVYLDLVWIE